MDKWCKIKPKVNLLIDIVMMIFMMALAGIGFMIKYLLLPGYRVNEVYGDNVELYFMGLDRHQWGAIHLYVALVLVFLLLLHIVFHWDMIICILAKMVKGRGARRVVLSMVGLVSLFLALAPFILNPEVRESDRPHHNSRFAAHETMNVPPGDGNKRASTEQGRRGAATYSTGSGLEFPDSAGAESGHGMPVSSGTESGNSDDTYSPGGAGRSDGTTATGEKTDHPVSALSGKQAGEERGHHYGEIDLDGTMTLNQVSARYNISVEQLANVIDVPVNRSDERLGRLRKLYGFDINKLREYVINYKMAE